MSTTDAHRPVPAPPGGLHSRVARRPLTAFLVLVAVAGWPLMSAELFTAGALLVLRTRYRVRRCVAPPVLPWRA